MSGVRKYLRDLVKHAVKLQIGQRAAAVFQAEGARSDRNQIILRDRETARLGKKKCSRLCYPGGAV